MVLKAGDACQTGKETSTNGVPSTDHGDQDNRGGHSFPKANRGKGMNSDDRVPSFPSTGLSHR